MIIKINCNSLDQAITFLEDEKENRELEDVIAESSEGEIIFTSYGEIEI